MTRNKKIHKLLILTTLTSLSGMAQAAIMLNFNPVIPTGQSVEVGIEVSGLGPETSPSISTYDFDIQFDATHLSFSNATFGDPTLGNQLDLFDFGLNETSADLTEPGVLNIFELSLDLANELNEFQAESFNLATLTFDVLRADSSQLELTINALGDADGNLLIASPIATTITTVPLPPAFWLMVSGICLFFRK